MQRLFFVLILSIGSFCAHVALSNQINNIERQHPELFANEIRPYKVVEDYYSPTGLSRDVEDNSKLYYTKEDKEIMNEQDRMLGILPFLNGLCSFLSVGCALVFVVLFYLQIDQYRKHKQLKSLRDRQETEKDRINLINRNFVKKVENIIKNHEATGTPMPYQEVLNIRTEMNNTTRDIITRNTVEEMIKKHMKVHNPKWK